MRRNDEKVDAIEFLAVDLGLRGQLEQRVERDDRLTVAGALADDAGPHGIVQFRIILLRHFIILHFRTVVMARLDRAIHSATLATSATVTEWIAGSSPAMTTK